MWMKRVMTALTTASVLGVLLAGAQPAQAAPDPKLKVTKVTLGRSSVAVSGLNTVAVPIRVKGGYDSSEPGDANLTLVVLLKRTSGTGRLTYMVSTDLKRVSGTTQHGEWAGPLNVPSTANGAFKVTGVVTGPYFAYVNGGTMTDPTPYDGPTVTVTGYHLPKITAKVTPRIVPFGSPYTITWAVTDSATAKPYGTRIRALLGIDNQCVEFAGGDVVLTSTAGIAVKAYPASAGQWVNCLRLQTVPFDIAGLGLIVARPAIVSATPSATSAKVGTTVPVNGNVLGAPYRCKVILQRLYGATQWRGVSVGAVRQSGRFTVYAQPTYRGLIPYRVYFPPCYNYVAGLSRVFYIRGL
jgi:hypothetical protein